MSSERSSTRRSAFICSNQAVHFVDSRVTSGPDCRPQTQSAIWARPGVVYNANNDRIYMTTGNGTFNPSTLWGVGTLSEAGRWSTSSVRNIGSVVYSRIFFV